MQFKASFFRVCAVAAFSAVATTLVLAFLPELYPTIGAAGSRLSESTVQSNRWSASIHLLHAFLVLTFAVGVSMRIRRRNSAAALVSVLAFALWAFTLAALGALSLFALDHQHATNGIGDVDLRAAMHTLDSMRGALFVLLSIGFVAGNVALGAAMTRSKGMTRTVGYFFAAAAALSLLHVFSVLGLLVIPTVLTHWIGALVQIVGCAAIGLWLWRYAMDEG